MTGRLILTSYGFTTVIGRKLIGKKIKKDAPLGEKRIFLFHEPHYSVEKMLVDACVAMGFRENNIILSGQQKSNLEILEMDFIYVTEGNTFEVLSLLRERGLVEIVREAVANGTTYIGASAGAMIAGTSIEEAGSFERNFIRMTDYEGLGLFDGIVIPHYTKSDLERYIKNEPDIVNKYGIIINIENDGVREIGGDCSYGSQTGICK